MKYLTLNNGIKIPQIGLGIYDLHEEKAILDAIDMGYRLFDTAQMYGNERLLGNAIKKSNVPREEFFITTKLYYTSKSYEFAKKGIEQSLHNLQLDYIDLMLIHEPYKESLEMYRALEEAYEEGKIKAIGISNFNEKLYLDFIKKCNVIPAINQVEAHVFFTRKDLQKVMLENGTLMEAWSPLCAGKHDIFNNEVLISIGKKYNKTAAQIALKYLLSRDIIIIPKSANKERLLENISLFDFELTNEDIEKIEILNENKSLFGWY